MRVTASTGWAELTRRRVGLLGLGREGGASIARLVAGGTEPAALVDDRATEAEGRRVMAPDDGGTESLLACDVVVASPGVPPHHPSAAALAEAGVPVLTGLGLWLADVGPDAAVGITGTKGKSTTTTIATHLLRGLGHDVVAVGNLGHVPWHPDAAAAERYVMEVSSYQATRMHVGPSVVGISSLGADHLPWHGGLDAYHRDKLSLATRPGVRRVVVPDVPDLRAVADRLGPDVTWLPAVQGLDGRPDADEWIDRLGLLGDHNRRNARLALALVEALLDEPVGPARLVDAADGYERLPHRLTVVAERDRVTFVDDGLSTNPSAASAALDVFADRPLALLAGGMDRNVDLAPVVARLAQRRVPTLLVALPTSGTALAAAVRTAAPQVEVTEVTGDDGEVWLPDAVTRATTWAGARTGVVLLSPAAASHDHFTDYRARSAVFLAAVRAVANAPRETAERSSDGAAVGRSGVS